MPKVLSKDEKRLQKFIENNNWIFAKTYEKTAPHWYIVVDNLSPKARKEANWFIGYIKIAGTAKRFFSKVYTYLFLGDYKYWAMPGDNGVMIINRDLIKR